MDACEIANFLAKEFMTYQQFITLDGLSSGVPTQTTPTLTPTTLKSIEQTFIELQNSEPEGHQAGFVPPVVIGNNQYITSSSVTSDTEVSSKSGSSMWGSDSSIRPTPPVTPHNDIIQTTTSTRRNTGGRRPTKNLNISPEEEERRNVRRERNKMAAARCRKRRLDHTNALLQETDGLEQKKQALQTEIQQLQEERDELQFILESHRAVCRIHMVMAGRSVSPPDIKPFVFASLDSDDVKVKTEFIDSDISLGPDLLSPTGKKILLTSVTAANTLNSLNTMHPLPNKPSRPSTLNVPGAFVPSSNGLKSSSMADIAGIPITTPSAGIPFNFESLMEGGTGLTPVSGPLVPSCASQSQHRNGMSPNNGDLVTPDPTCTSKLVSL